MRKMPCTITLTLTAFLLIAGNAQAKMVFEEKFDGDKLASELWTINQDGPVNVGLSDGALRGLAGEGSEAKGRATFVSEMNGDFDVQIDYEAAAYGGKGDIRLQLYLSGPSSYAAVYYHQFGPDKNEVIFGGTLEGKAAVYKYLTDVPEKGKLRMSRNGSMFIAYYWTGTGWKAISSQKGHNEQVAIRIQMENTVQKPVSETKKGGLFSSSEKSPGFASFDFRVDNLRIEAESLTSTLKITAQPKGANRYTNQGDYALKVASSGGIGEVTYEWFFEGPAGGTSVGKGNTFTIAGPKPENSGKYTCKVSDMVCTLTSEPAMVTIAPPITISTQPVGATRYVEEGDYSLSVAATGGLAALTYEWMHDGKSVGKEAALPIAGPKPENSGKYWCVVADGTSKVESEKVSVIFGTPIALTEQPKGEQRYTGKGELKLTVAATGGAGPLKYEWLLDKGSGPAAVGKGAVLTIADPKPEHSGTYTCNVSDALKTVTSEPAAVTIAEPLTLTAQPQSAQRYIEEGDYALTVGVAGGLGALTYEWTFDPGSGPTPAGTEATLNITGPTPERSGKYTCKVADSTMSVTSEPATVVFAPALAFTTQPAGAQRYVTDGEYALTAATSGGIGTVNYVWKFDPGSGPVDAGTGATITIVEPTPEKSGTYWCEATDGLKTVPSEKVTVTFGQPLTFTTQPTSVSMYTGAGPLRLTVATSGGIGTVAYQWKFDNGSGPAPVGTDAAYTVESPTPINSGKYVCEATDALKTVASDTVDVQVAEHLTITEPPKGEERYVDAGPFSLAVATAGGLGAVSYQWMFDAGSGPNPVGTTNPYTIETPAPENSGKYWCEVKDANETVESEPVSVAFVPHLAITTQPKGGEFHAEAEPFSLKVETSGGLGGIAYQWTFDDGTGPKPAGTTNPFTIEKPTAANSGKYLCEVKDTKDTVKSEEVTVTFGPNISITKQPTGGKVAAGAAHTFAVEASGGMGTLHYQWKFENAEKKVTDVGIDAPNFTIEKMAPENAGKYSVEVRDNAGKVVSDAVELTVE